MLDSDRTCDDRLAGVTSATKRTGQPRLVVFDVDGVILESHFLLAMSKRVGWRAYLKTWGLCFRFNAGRLSVGDLVRRTYARFDGQPRARMVEVCRAMKKREHARETIAAFRRTGAEVWLVSSGVPDFLVGEIAGELGADGGKGIEVDFEDGHATGRIAGRLLDDDGKEAAISDLLTASGIEWEDMAVIADDRCNIPVVRRAGVSVGVHANYPLRREADYLVDTNDLHDVWQFVGVGGTSGRGAGNEAFRKAVHLLGAVFAFTPPWVAACVLAPITAAAALQEVMRLNGVRVPVLGDVMWASCRGNERRRPAFAPFALSFGILGSLFIFPIPIARASVLIAALADTAAAILGRRYGKTPLPYNREKTLEGTLACLVAAFACAVPCVSVPAGAIGAVTAAIVESMPLKHFENFVLPLAAGSAMAAASVLSQNVSF